MIHRFEYAIVVGNKAEQGESAAQAELATLYSQGDGVRLDFVTAYMWMLLACKENQAATASLRELAEFMTAADILEAEQRADQWFVKTAENIALIHRAEQGDHAAQTLLGVCYANGKQGIAKNMVHAYMWTLLASGNNSSAKANLPIMAQSMIKSQIKEAEELANNWYVKSEENIQLFNKADQGHSEAQALLGYHYALGMNGIKKDFIKACMWTLLAHDNSTSARNNLPILLQNMQPEQIQEAEQLAGNWFPKSRNNLALMKRVVEKDPEAQLSLGTMYAQGDGVRKNIFQAYMWTVMAKWRSEKALPLLSTLAQELSQAQINEAEKRAGEWFIHNEKAALWNEAERTDLNTPYQRAKSSFDQQAESIDPEAYLDWLDISADHPDFLLDHPIVGDKHDGANPQGLADANSKIYVVGNCHSYFWRGVDFSSRKAPIVDYIPGICVKGVGAALAYDLITSGTRLRAREKTLGFIKAALANGFTGWIMLSFGEIDIRCFVVKLAIKIGLTQAVACCVRRYLSFVDEVRLLHDKVALWAPPPSSDTYSVPYWLTVGSETERNYATVLFTEMLQKWSGVPVLSVLHLALLDNGLGNKEVYCPSKYPQYHLAPEKLLPFVLEMVQQKLGVRIDAPCANGFSRQEITSQVIFSTIDGSDQQWLSCDMQAIRHIDSISLIGPACYEKEFHLVLTNNNSRFITLQCKKQSFRVGEGRDEQIKLNHAIRFILVPYDSQGHKPDVRIYALAYFLDQPEMRHHLSWGSMFQTAKMLLDGAVLPDDPHGSTVQNSENDGHLDEIFTKARQGEVASQSLLAKMYFTGEGLSQDFVEALQWSHLAAEQGDLLAQHQLGMLYAGMPHITANYSTAYKWATIACRELPMEKRNRTNVTLREQALENLYVLERYITRKLSPALIDEAKALAHAWLQGKMAPR
ncbi:MAG: SEL1-like repeat protein [Magnetococcales bacterium]|nr:SEL1-like repeat protein [Magnetococcales bacterium]